MHRLHALTGLARFGLARFVVALVCLAALSGCSSPWREAYVGAPTGSFAPVEWVQIREVPWSRVRTTLDELEAERAARDVHYTEWSDEQREAEKAELLRGLQVSDDPANVAILGRSVFRSTANLRPGDDRLRSFARKLGADLVVVSSVYTGKAERVQHESVTVHRDRYVGSRHRRDGHYTPTTETISVPIVVEVDEFAWVVYFLRTAP